MKAPEAAKAHFLECGSCAVAMVKALKEVYPSPSTLNENSLEGFGGGFAGSGAMCGVYSAATLVLSHCMVDEITPEKRMEVFQTLNECVAEISDGYKGRKCMDITGCDFSNEEDLQRYEKEVFEPVCGELVRKATAVIERYLQKQNR